MKVIAILDSLSISLENFRNLASDLEILATEETEPYPYEKVRETLKDPTVVERRIIARYSHSYSHSSLSLINYVVEDYAVEDERMVIVGKKEYTSEDLAELTRQS